MFSLAKTLKLPPIVPVRFMLPCFSNALHVTMLFQCASCFALTRRTYPNLCLRKHTELVCRSVGHHPPFTLYFCSFSLSMSPVLARCLRIDGVCYPRFFRLWHISRGRSEKEEDEEIISAYVWMGQNIEAMGLEGVWSLKPFLNGIELKTLLPNLPRGPEFSRVVSVSAIRQMVLIASKESGGGCGDRTSEMR